jgi:hypothetical protein
MQIMVPQEPAVRLARAAVFATVCIVVSAVAHVFAGGGAIAPAMLLLCALGAFVLAYLLGGCERGIDVVLGTTIGAQAVLHELFARAALVPSEHAAHGHLALRMTVAHLVVAVLTGWWLHRGESALWLMLRLLGMPRLLLPRLLALRVETTAASWPTVPDDMPIPAGAQIAAAVHRRGPPLPSLS